MFSLTYDLWNSIIDEAVYAHSPLFEAVQRAADDISLSKSLVDELKQEATMVVLEDSYNFLLAIELYDDDIGGFKVSLMAAEGQEVFEAIKERAVAAHDVTFEDIRNFEVEHGLDIEDEILNGIEEKYSVYAEKTNENIVFERVIFDSEDTDNNSRMSNGAGNENGGSVKLLF